MKKQTFSPAITSFQWGEVKTEDGNIYKDVKLFPGGSREWDWNETGTSHVPGIQPEDVMELLEHNVEVVILSKGVNRRLQTCDETIEMLEDKGIKYHILQSEEAVQKYNELQTDQKVGALIHSTC